MATIFRGAVSTSIARKRAVEVAQAPNRLLTLLAVVTIAKVAAVVPVERLEAQQPELGGAFRGLLDVSPTPFAQRDWPNPTHRRARQQPDPGGSAYGKTLTVVDLNGGRTDLSFSVDNLRRTERQEPSQRVRSLALQTPVVVAPFAQLEWPNPVIKRHVRPQLLWRMVADAPEAPPFYQNDWPQTGRLAIEPDTLPPNSAILIPVDRPFSIQLDLPTPRPDKIESHTLATVVYEPEAPQPFALDVWPDRVRKRETAQDQRSSALAGPLNTVQTVPFTQSDWPRITRKVARFQETPQPNRAGTLFVITAKPFALTDWPTAELKFVREDHNRTNLIGTLPPPEIPFALDDWPNPLRKTDPHFDIWGQSLQHTTLFVENVKPFNQSDWNVGFLFDPRPIYPFISYQPKVIIEGVGLPGLQPPTYVVGPMYITFGLGAATGALGIGLDGVMQHTFGVDGSFDETEGFEGPV